MRCFFAIDLPGELRREIVKIQKQIPQDMGIKFVEPENLHLTLKFFGEISDKKVNKIKEILGDFKFKKIKCHLGDIGFFPSSSYIRVVWVSLEPGNKIKELEKKINENLQNKDERKDERFESHITLARVKFVKDKKKFVEQIKNLKVKPIEIDIDSFLLKKSQLTEKGPIYEIIKEFKF
jgi:2'-5' RNA ligase